MLGTSRGPVDIAVAVDNLISARRRHPVHRRRRRHAARRQRAVRGGPQARATRSRWSASRRRSTTTCASSPAPSASSPPCEEAVHVIDSAHTEARSVDNGIALVKLMGRHAGFIAAAATVASQDVNFCLVPEVPFALEGPGGLLAKLERPLAEEGSRRHRRRRRRRPGTARRAAARTDASGNLKLQGHRQLPAGRLHQRTSRSAASR